MLTKGGMRYAFPPYVLQRKENLPYLNTIGDSSRVIPSGPGKEDQFPIMEVQDLGWVRYHGSSGWPAGIEVIHRKTDVIEPNLA